MKFPSAATLVETKERIFSESGMKHAFSVPEDGSTLRLIKRIEKDAPQLLLTVLSMLSSVDVLTSDRARAEITFGVDRRARYARISRRLPLGAHVLKGEAIARHYAPGALRSANDLDIYCSTHNAMAESLQVASDSAPDVAQCLVLGPNLSDYMIELQWRSMDALFREPFSVCVSTQPMPMLTYQNDIQIKLDDPESPESSVLMIAAERLERAFGPKDIIDIAALSPSCDWDVLTERAATVGLTDCFNELLEHFSSFLVTGTFSTLFTQSHKLEVVPPSSRGMPGYFLGPSNLDGPIRRVEVESLPVLITPIGSFLLTVDGVVEDAEVRAACSGLSIPDRRKDSE